MDFFEVNSNGKFIRNKNEYRNDTIYITENFLKDNKLKMCHLKLIVNRSFFNALRKTILSVNLY